MNEAQEKRQYPIRTVSEITGVNAVTLRAWERRYGLIKPLRTPKGHRLYTDEHIDLISKVCERLNQGITISRIADDLKQEEDRQNRDDSGTWVRYRDDMIDAVQRFDERGLDRVYNEANAMYPVDIVTKMLIVPMLELIGDRWSRQQGTVAEEHFFSVYLRNKIGARFHHRNTQNKGHKIVAACMPGELHEFGLLLFALSAHSRGYRIIMLGANMPIEDLAQVAQISGSGGIVLTGSAYLDCAKIREELRTLIDATDTPIFIGGDIVDSCSDVIDSVSAHSIGSDITSGLSTITRILSS